IRSHASEDLPTGAVRHLQLEDHDRDDDGDHAVAESCEAIFPLGCDLTSYQIVVVKAELCITAKLAADVRDGSLASETIDAILPRMLALPPTADKLAERPVCLLCANRKLMQCSKPCCYSITPSARASSVAGTCIPSVLAVFRLMVSSTFVNCWTGRSAGF